LPAILSVSQLNRYLSLKIGGDLKLKGITVRGELSDFKIHYKSGHAYFTLKDEASLIKGVMFSRTVSRLGFMPQSGMSVLCSGNIEIYEAGGVYQIIATELIPAGIGAKFMQLNALKDKLSEQGIFAQERKKSLPAIPKRIAVVTSLGGAALQDVLNILKRRYPVGEAVIFSAQVQGEKAAVTIANALHEADSSNADVIILTRGGGSFEDLMPFNTEEVALAVARCKTPVISAVGHETDTTLADYAADKRAPTPSAAAEICAPTADIMAKAVDSMQAKLQQAFEKNLALRFAAVDVLTEKLRTLSPDSEILSGADRLSSLNLRLEKAAEKYLAANNARLEKCAEKLEALSPYNVLERGYSIVLKNGETVTDRSKLKENDEVTIRFGDFAVNAIITGFADI
jgi:exodeoxyribonuclease VII large subunit